MKLLHKRILIMFSVTLNIGFVIMAIITIHNHSKPFNERPWLEIVAIVHRLKLPEDRETAVMDTIRQFRDTFDRHHQEIKQARGDIIRLLAADGPVDPEQLHQRMQAADLREKSKNEAFEAHVLKLRDQLGNEKGALFFSLLLEHINAEDESPPR